MGQPQREAIREANAHIEQLHQRMVDQDTLFRRSIAEKDTQIAMLEQQLASRSQLEAALQSAYDTIRSAIVHLRQNIVLLISQALSQSLIPSSISLPVRALSLQQADGAEH
eukprot:m.387354 g.387354  ORF g.387354 m.387354 type:complete len:111 (+) comp56314_c0_seq3:1638-1970(+)